MTFLTHIPMRSHARPVTGMAQFLYLDSTQSEVLKAASFANRRLEGRIRANPPEPEIEHAYRVANVVRNLLQFDEPVYSVVALLHDVLEKTTTDPELIDVVFGTEVADAVKALTRPKGGGRSAKAERAHVAKVLAASDVAVTVKIADLIDNLVARSHAGEVEGTLAKANAFLDSLSTRPLSVQMKVARQMLANTIEQVKA